ncbi:response regulator transcription factor [Helicovermis profundi]|uniref:Stage 0 sporulation protein A homolog n=1 Tax=Helicovermis profundi TaxID=3065157 RepID=A0AAU9EEC8_9FIRM|nr:response regulator transcription factor [Clostridia bacterium S502]
MKHIFVVDDEKNIRELINKYLIKEGYKTTTFSNGNTVEEEIFRLKPDLIVLDINMPGINGLDLTKKIRKNSEIPIIFVTARDDEFDRVIGLEIGGDDYLSKPFSPRELVARIKNIFRRIDKGKNMTTDSTIEFEDIRLDRKKRIVKINENFIELTTKEYELFEFLLVNAGIPFERETMIEKIWGYDFLGETRVIDDLVKRIRKKIKLFGSIVEIKTVWGYGYKIEKK